ncbi:MAG: hypothetical protein WC788_04620 [Candidatus Paceibacterota bacterium]
MFAFIFYNIFFGAIMYFSVKKSPTGGIKIKEEINKIKLFIENRKAHAISYMMNEYPDLGDNGAEEIYRLGGQVWKWVFILTILLALFGSFFHGEFGILYLIGIIIYSAIWATMLGIAVIFLGKHSLGLRDKAIRAWQEIKKP